MDRCFNLKMWQKVLIVSGIVAFMSIGGFFVWKGIADLKNQMNLSSTSGAKDLDFSAKPENDTIKFSHQIFDPNKVSFITPLGELNGGYVETQTINGVMINLKTADPIDVFAPTDMTLEDYSYASDGRNTANWHIGFRINQDMKLSFDHITWLPDELRAVTPPTQSSGTVPPTKKLSFRAGDLIAKTSGTDRAHNWNIYLRDNRNTNTFVNGERYDKLKQGYAFVNAVCPFDYYDDSIKQTFLTLMGATQAGQSNTCGNPSKDVKGSISGLWHLSKETNNSTFMGSYIGNYATPFSIYKNSAGEIIIYEVGRKRYILGTNNSTLKDPATITESHCYNLTEWPEERQTRGYAYFRVVNDMEMKIAYSATGSCPSSFPENNSITYYR